MDICTKCYEYTMADDFKKADISPCFHALQSRQAKEVAMEGGAYVNPVLPAVTQPGNCLLRTIYM